MSNVTQHLELVDMAKRTYEQIPVTNERFHLPMLVEANENFQKDRPLMDQLNSVPKDVRALLIGEIRELNGHHPEYMTLNDYRQQEVADILMFVLSLAESLNIELREGPVHDVAEFHYRYHGIQPVSIEKPLQLAVEFDDRSARIYEELKHALMFRANELEKIRLGKPTKERVQTLLEGITADCFALYALLGVNPIRATLEKIMRNILKYNPQYFQMTDEVRAKQGKRGYRQLVRQVYAQQRQLSVAAFDGSKDPVTGKRPETGGRDFYQGDAPMIEYFRQQGGLR